VATIRLATANRLRLRGPGHLALSAGAAAVNAVLALTDPTNLTVYQRVGTNKSLAVSGSFTGSIAQVQARAVPVGTSLSDTSVAWSNVATDNTAKTYSGNVVVAQGGWYVWQVRDAANAATNAVGVDKFGVGLVIALIGQSNMVNFTTTPSKYPLGDPKAIECVNGVLRRLGNTNDAYAPNTLYGTGGYGSYTGGSSNGDGAVFLANLVSEGLNLPVCILNKAVGGSPISGWMTGQNNWTNFVSALNALGGDCEIALWFQGESDASTGMSTATMVSNLGTLHSQLKTQTGRDSTNLHFGIVSLGPVSLSSSYSGSSDSKVGAIRAAHVQYGNGTAGAFLATAAHDTNTSDGVHILGEGHSRWGRRASKSVLARFGVGVSGSGPRITSATRSGTVVTLGVTHAGGTALTDGAGGSGAALTGFAFRDAGAGGATINYTTAISGNTIVCTLASVPTGALTVEYAMMNAPHSSDSTISTSAPVLASCVYDNATYHDGVSSPFTQSAVGCPLQPLAAMTVS
jgi:hypothetical protein